MCVLTNSIDFKIPSNIFGGTWPIASDPKVHGDEKFVNP